MIDSKLILEALATKRCIDVTYNRMRMRLAPHILYTKHGDLFVDAVSVEREGKKLTDPRIGTFKLIGLQDGAIADAPFEPFAEFNLNDEKYGENTVFAVS